MLTPEKIRELWENYSPTKGIESFARSVEAEVRKDDADLIEQMLDAMERVTDWDKARDFCVPYRVRDPIHKAIAAARARLEKAP